MWSTCDIIVIEQQYFNTFSGRRKKSGNGANIDAIKLAELTFGWFLDRFPNKEITYFGSQFKTQILGAPTDQNKLQRKKWSVEKGFEIYTLRDDEEMVKIRKLRMKMLKESE